MMDSMMFWACNMYVSIYHIRGTEHKYVVIKLVITLYSWQYLVVFDMKPRNNILRPLFFKKKIKILYPGVFSTDWQ